MKKIILLTLLLSVTSIVWSQNSKETIQEIIEGVDFTTYKNENIVLNRKTFISQNGEIANDYQIFNAPSFNIILKEEGLLLVDKYKKYYVSYKSIKTLVLWPESFTIWLHE